MRISFIVIILFLSGAAGFILKLKKNTSGQFFKDLVIIWAAAMIGVSLVHIFPEVTRLFSGSSYVFVAGFLTIYLIENAFMIHACVEHDCHFHHTSILSWAAIIIHTVFDGVAISAAFASENTLWWTVLVGVVIHQIPVSISLISLLTHSQFSKKIQNTLLSLFIIAAPSGYLCSKLFFSNTSEPLIATIILAFSGGSLLYLGASDILPSVHKKTTNHSLVAALFFLTILLVAGTKVLE